MRQPLPDGWVAQPSEAMFSYVKLNDNWYQAGVYRRPEGWILRAPNNVRLGPFDSARAAMLAYKLSKSSNAI